MEPGAWKEGIAMTDIIMVLLSVPAAIVALFDLCDKVSALIEWIDGEAEAQD